MEVSTRYRDGITILDIVGEIIGNARFELNNVMQEIFGDDCNGIIMNLEEVPMLDSVGLGMITGVYTEMARKEKRLILLNAGQSIQYLLVITKLYQIFEKYNDEDEALESFKKEEEKEEEEANI